LLGHQAVFYKQKNGKGFQKKHNVSIVVRILGIVLRLDPKGWEHGIQPPPYEVDTPEPEDTGEGSVRSNSPESWGNLPLQILEDILPEE
jgi:hypothetical protein